MIELLRKFNKNWQTFLLISIFCLPFFINLGGNSLWDGNEGFYAEPAREVVESGNYLIPTYNYQPRFKKPPLATWIIAFSYQTLGVSEFAERLPIAIAAILTIWITYFLGKLIADKELGIISALVLATMLKFMIYCRQYAGDIFLTLFISLTMLYFARAMIETERKKQNLYKFLAYLAMGLGMLDKGIVAIVVPMTMVGLFILLLRRWELIKLLFSPTGYVITGVVGASWYTLMYWKYGWDFIQVNIINETVKRYVTDELGGRAIYYYVGVYFSETLPWSIFIIPAIIYWLKCWKEEKLNISQEKLKSFLPFLTIIWFIFIFIFFSLSIGKRAVYLVALYPAAAIIIAYYFRFNLFNHNKLLTNLQIVLSSLLAIVCLASSVIIFLAYQKLEIRTNLIYLAITALVLLSLGLIVSLKKLELQLPVI
ncbi:MAG: glycosyltransferase family 39 protein, partial [Blastocatellia bacterium]|nr:glycosyltransferase family 39 protein [Blastocatellia bacterium]